MRRSQTARHHHARPSLALGADDLGVLREGDETNEDVLRRQLLEKDRECEKLQMTILALKEELRLRPSIEQYQEFEKEKKNLEIILQGTQRENERSFNENNRMKKRIEMLEGVLVRLAGENWQTNLEIPPAPTTSRGLAHQRSNTIAMGSLPNTPHTPRPRTPKSGHGRSTSPASVHQQPQRDSLLTVSQIEDVRMLILGMDQRLATREGNLVKLVDRAEKESERCERLGGQLLET